MPGMERVPCPHCGEKNFARDPLCLRCGRTLFQRPIAEPETPPRSDGIVKERGRSFASRRLLLLAVFLVVGLGGSFLFKPPRLSAMEWLTRKDGAVLWGVLLFTFAAYRLVLWLVEPPHWRDLDNRPSDSHSGGGFP